MKRKFRIWDIETKQFIYWKISEIPPTCLTKDYIEENTNQFTGLLDKNGKEIYEGDIVIWNKHTGVIEWLQGMAGYYFMKDGGGFHFHECQEIILPHRGLKHIEVIGNIYESSELLKGEK